MSTYDQVIVLSKQYLGPAAEKFIERQCKCLKTDPVKLMPNHMEELSWLTKNAAGLVMDAPKALEFSTKMKAIK